MRALLLAGVVLVGWIGTADAVVTYTNNWSFVDTNTNTVVAGTLSGLQDGTGQNAYGLTATVTQSIFADLLHTFSIDGNGSTYSSRNTYSASDGVVYYASFQLRDSSNNRLYFGTSPSTGSYFPELRRISSGDSLNSLSGTTFAAIAADEPAPTAVPEPATLALLGLGTAGVLAARRRRRTA